MLRYLKNASLSLGICWASTGALALADNGLKMGTPDLKQAGKLAFAPDGILLVGDTVNAAIYAIDTGDSSGNGTPAEVNIEGINHKIAAMVGATAEETLINDMAVNPATNNIFLSVSRGRGPDAIPMIFKVDAKGQLSEVALQNVQFAMAKFENAPESNPGRRDPRVSTITDIQYNDGKIIVAGLSNEEFASKLRVLDFPFNESTETSVEVYHGAHGKLETHSPVRTFITYENTVLAAYTCTPLVTIPVEDLSGDKVMGKTVAELGNRNQPLDMIVYRKGEQDYLLLANSARGVMRMKLSKQDLDSVNAIQSRVADTAGLTYETLAEFEGVAELDKLGEEHAVMLIASTGGNLDLKTVALP